MHCETSADSTRRRGFARLQHSAEPEKANALDARAAALDDAVAAPAPQRFVHNHRPDQQAADEEGADKEDVVYECSFCVLHSRLLLRSTRIVRGLRRGWRFLGAGKHKLPRAPHRSQSEARTSQQERTRNSNRA